MIAAKSKDQGQKETTDPRINRFKQLQAKLLKGQELTPEEREAYPDLERFARDR